MDVRLIHILGEAVELRCGGQLLFRYVYAPGTASFESPRPYFHPVRTMRGNEVTIFRPHDHPWHVGLSMTCAHLSGENFWGGPTYVRGSGYEHRDDHGRIEHLEWQELRTEGGLPRLTERLDWITHEGELWIEETRRISVSGIEEEEGWWSLDLRFALRNVSGHALVFGSPTTQGRPMAGYGGLFWRGPRSFTGGEILAAEGLEGPDVMGRASPWLAFIGAHDGSGERSTLVFRDSPSNPRYPCRWFVRSEPYACASCSPAFDEEYVLEASSELVLSYHVTIADGSWSRQRIERLSDAQRGPSE